MATTEELHVLVIDDDDAVLDLLVKIVTAEGHVALGARSAEEGLALLPAWTFQVAFIDQHLPGMDGLMLGEYLRHNNPDMTIALVTADDAARLKRQSADLGITYIHKPFRVPAVVAVLDAYRAAAAERARVRREETAADFAPPIATYVADLADAFSVPHVPSRVEERLCDGIKRSLNNLRTTARYSERDRVLALSGLLAASVLGIRLPRASSGRSLFEEYDDLMTSHGRRPEFAARDSNG